MFFTLIRLQFLKSIRSTSFAKSLLVAIFLVFIALLLLTYVFLAGLFLGRIIEELAEGKDAITYLNSAIIYFFLFEFVYRYFIQKLPVADLESLLHLPIGKAKIIHVLLLRSFLSPMNLIALLLFLPFGVQVVGEQYGSIGAITWVGTILLFSWSLHWLMLWFKQRFEDSFYGLLVVGGLLILGGGSNYLGWFNLGEFAAPFFNMALKSVLPFGIVLIAAVGGYLLANSYYKANAYLEDLSEEEDVRFVNQSFGFLSRFGLAGELANLEWKLIIRHKKSRTYLMLSAFFLLYGLVFYTNPIYQSETGLSAIFIFVGIFITGIFTIQYGQQFLSWNSGNFDFFISRKGGVESLVRGKYLLFMGVSMVCFLASVPYVYFGVHILMIHLATFFFNVGIMIHVIIYLALWKPKPMDLNKGAMFNYEGVGAAQFLIIIPLLVAPYLVYLPFSLLISDTAGLIALGAAGLIGLLAFRPLSQININRVLSNRYEISSSFRQEL
ncbi:hypothetical protein AO498_00325 [Algoriphagus sanaruensis]|uniref:Uncharacterized protein n=2 Tax=Algoriphagus sanaruensis TaxID=1727163 RepID=A0A142EI64_9BACT|nr:DUF5687 family protein [Algoriphagus sanaruensis]AMQ54819.1 hypothetical protein AO498_00325 [Algoriphagus sanaruensis]